MMNPSSPHRKPVPAMQRSYNDLPQQAQAHSQQMSMASHYPDNYSRPRAPSTSPSPSPSPAPPSQPHHHPPRFSSFSSTSSVPGNPGIQRMPTNSSSLPRRSTSSRSTTSASPTSYVALMRKQKATVWCDRAQHEDPNILAQQRKAKNHAALIVAGGKHHGSRASTSSSIPSGSMGIRSKIRHQGAAKAHAYLGGANMSGAGVPIRLSATEVDENDSDEDYDSKHGKFNRRGGSGRSSNGSGGVRSAGGYTGSNLGLNNHSPPAAHSPPDSLGYDPDEQTPVPNATNTNQSDYFEGSTDDGEAEQDFGGLGVLPPSKAMTEQDLKRAEELRRRGSVDERNHSITMGVSRLFVANPDDLSD